MMVTSYEQPHLPFHQNNIGQPVFNTDPFTGAVSEDNTPAAKAVDEIISLFGGEVVSFSDTTYRCTPDIFS